MKSFLKFLLIAFAILLTSAILAPKLFEVLPFKFERIFNRLIMIFTLIACVLFVRVSKKTFRDYGFGWTASSIPYFLKGFVAGVFILSFFVVLRVLTGYGALTIKNMGAVEWAGLLVKMFFTGALIGVIEEFFFRGFIFRSLEKWKWPALGAAVATSFFYAILHFVDQKSPYIGPNPHFQDSLKLIAAPFSSFMDWQAIWPGVLGLFLFGLILNDLYYRTRSLYPAIGLHAGCVFFVKLDSSFVDFLKADSLLWGGNKVYDGAIGWGFLALLFLFTRLFIKEENKVAA